MDGSVNSCRSAARIPSRFGRDAWHGWFCCEIFGVLLAGLLHVSRRIADTQGTTRHLGAEKRRCSSAVAVNAAGLVLMPNSNVLIIESNGTRADIVTSALQFMGFYPQRWDASLPTDSMTHDWRAVYIGGFEDETLCEQLLASLEVPADQLLVLVGSDSPQLERMTRGGSPYAA